MKGDCPVFQYITIILGGLVFLFILVVAIIPSIISFGQGVCWSEVDRTLDHITDDVAEFSKSEETLTLGNCVDFVGFLNVQDYSALSSSLRSALGQTCLAGSTAYLVATPSDSFFQQIARNFNVPLGSIEPLCYPLQKGCEDCVFTGERSSRIVVGPTGTEETKVACVNIERSSEVKEPRDQATDTTKKTWGVSITPGHCKKVTT